MWRSAGVTVSNGLIKGSNSPTGVGVMFENDDKSAIGGAIENVDAINMGNGCFSGYPARFLLMIATRCGWNRCDSQGGRPPPASHGQMWAAGHPVNTDSYVAQQMKHSSQPHDQTVRSHGIVVARSTYWAPCNASKPAAWSRSPDGFAIVQIKRHEFLPRQPLTMQFCWESRRRSRYSGSSSARHARLKARGMARVSSAPPDA